MERKKAVKERFYAAKKTVNIWDVNADNIVTWELVKKNLILSIWLDIQIKL